MWDCMTKNLKALNIHHCLVQNVLLDFCFRQELLKWNGWGYKDSKFVVENRIISFTGNRYVVSFWVVWSKWVCMICLFLCVESNGTSQALSFLLLGMPLANSLFPFSQSGFWINLILIGILQEVLSQCLKTTIYHRPLSMQVLSNSVI